VRLVLTDSVPCPGPRRYVPGWIDTGGAYSAADRTSPGSS
jgi:hypothetical protein